jgi:DNA-directed RNA polymerase subunit alpha
MTQLTCIESYINPQKQHYGCFVIEPLEIGQSITLGNSIRRTLLSDLNGFAITGVRINNLKHEFGAVEGLREDTLEILANLKEIVIKGSYFNKKDNKDNKIKGYLFIKGPSIITSGMINFPKNTLKLINPNQYICTITKAVDFYMEVDIEQGNGYKLSNTANQKDYAKALSNDLAKTLVVDSIFMPVKTVNYKTKLIHDSKGNIKESLHLDILTNGSITPKRCLHESIKILANLFYSLILDSKVLCSTTQLALGYYK